MCKLNVKLHLDIGCVNKPLIRLVELFSGSAP